MRDYQTQRERSVYRCVSVGESFESGEGLTSGFSCDLGVEVVDIHLVV